MSGRVWIIERRHSYPGVWRPVVHPPLDSLEEAGRAVLLFPVGEFRVRAYVPVEVAARIADDSARANAGDDPRQHEAEIIAERIRALEDDR